MEVNFYEEGKHLIIVPSGKLDTINAPEFGKIFAEQLERKIDSCLLDLSAVSFLSSSGLQVLLAGAKISKKNGTQFAVFAMQEMISDVFYMSGFNQFINDFSCKEDAIV